VRGTAKSESEQKMKMVWGRVLLLAATVAGLEVAIEDYFGDVTFLQGKKQTVVCTVEDPDPVGAIRWRIGDRLLDPRECAASQVGSCLGGGGPLEEVEDGVFQQSLTFVPALEDDKKHLVCEFLVAGEEPTGSALDQITLHVYQRDLKIVEPRPAKSGQSSVLQVKAKLYPPPKEEDFLWRVEHSNGDLVVELGPGETSPLLPGYKPSNIQDEGNGNYLLTFTIVSMSREEAENRFTLTVSSPEPSKTLKFNVPYMMSESESGSDQQSQPTTVDAQAEEAAKSEDEEDVEVTTSNVGLFIIIGLLVLCLVLCIIFCAVRRRKKKPEVKRSASDGKGAFAPVSSKDAAPANV